MPSTRGVVYIHSAPSALCPHIEWAIGASLGAPISLDWAAQPVERSSYRTELSWAAKTGTGAKIASALKAWNRIRFEVTEEATSGTEAERYCVTPNLGVFHAITGLHGDIMIPEDRLKAAVVSEALGGKTLLKSLDELLGRAWDDELEPFRHAGDDTSVRWLHQVV